MVAIPVLKIVDRKRSRANIRNLLKGSVHIGRYRFKLWGAG
jgi:hypothetical protein